MHVHDSNVPGCVLGALVGGLITGVCAGVLLGRLVSGPVHRAFATVTSYGKRKCIHLNWATYVDVQACIAWHLAREREREAVACDMSGGTFKHD